MASRKSSQSKSTVSLRHHGRPLDVVLWGATGFTGALVAEYLAERSTQTGLRWGIAARDLAKLEGVRDQVMARVPDATPPELMIAESFDRESLIELARSTRAICSTVGPYAQYGSELVSVCVEEDTDYCDLTGEVHWVRRMIDAHHEEAVTRGTRIVPFSGFDSIPSDLGTLMLQRYALETFGVPCDQVKFAMLNARGGFSGGTVASMLNMFDEASRDREVLRISAHPYGLNPPDARKGPDRGDDMKVRHDEDFEAWLGPFIMGPVNTRVVRRSNALLDFEYGREFRYSESVRFGGGATGFAAAALFSAGFMGFGAAVAVAPTRELLRRYVLPKPGEGPNREKRESGFFKVELRGKARGERVVARVGASKDPGYGATAVMLGETVCCLALDREATPARGGVLTPASALGMTLVDRLREAGMTFEVGRG